MSAAEILEIEPSPELNGALEQGLRSLEEVRDKIAQWAGLSP